MEIWNNITGFEGYQVSNLGRVKHRDRILKPRKSKGYLTVAIWSNKVRKNKLIHRLVAEAFIPNPDNKSEIDHIDADKTNNRVENLRWCTRKENINNPLNLAHFKRYPVVKLNTTGKCLEFYSTILLAGQHGNVIKCCKGKRKTAGGYRWLYYEDYEAYY